MHYYAPPFDQNALRRRTSFRRLAKGEQLPPKVAGGYSDDMEIERTLYPTGIVLETGSLRTEPLSLEPAFAAIMLQECLLAMAGDHLDSDVRQRSP